MLKISKLADYATLIMAYCADQPQIAHNAKKVALDTKLQLPTVSKILKVLAKAGLLDSQRGVQGGYQLSRTAEKINLADIVAAIDGPLAMTECNQTKTQCELLKNCATKHSWQYINQIVHQALANISLENMRAQSFIK